MRRRDEFSTKVRRDAYARSGGKCEKCGNEFTEANPLDFHHIIAAKDGGTGALENCQALCFKCHRPGRRLHKHRKLAVPFSTKILQIKATPDIIKAIDDWRRAYYETHKLIPTRSDAVRQLIEIAVKTTNCR